MWVRARMRVPMSVIVRVSASVTAMIRACVKVAMCRGG